MAAVPSALAYVGALLLAVAASSAEEQRPAGEQHLRFTDATAGSGLSFCHSSPPTPQRHTHLVMGSGIAWLDFDRDGLPDLFAAQGAPFHTHDRSAPSASDRLFRNSTAGQFTDVSAPAGIHDAEYSMGIAVGDYNNDGFCDIYVSNFGRNRLWQNNGDGTYHELAAELNLDDPRFGASCTWADLDADGNLDLFVANYLRLDPHAYQVCTQEHRGELHHIVCHPRSVPPEADVAYRNHGDGQFSVWNAALGINETPAAPGLGVIAADLDGDGDCDVYVANDSVPNHLWINDGRGRLLEQGFASGTALNRRGEREAGMGVVAGDVDGDGLPDLFVTNYFAETNTLYRNEGAGLFFDVTDDLGLGAPSRPFLGFGTNLFDFDNDGWLDLFVANGHVHDNLHRLGRNEPFEQKPLFFHNRAGRRFEQVAERLGPYFHRKSVGRSSAVADFDRDGRLDLAVSHLNSPLTLLRNSSAVPTGIAIELVGTRANRDAIGAVVDVRAAGRCATRIRPGSTGYLSCDEGVLTIGLGHAAEFVDVSVRWPAGPSESFRLEPTSGIHVLIEGRGTSASTAMQTSDP